MHKGDAEWVLTNALKVIQSQSPDARTEVGHSFSGWYLRLPTYDGRVLKVSIEDVTREEQEVQQDG